MSKILPVVLSGGSGTRLWPLSREKYPKQLLPLVDEQSMLQATVARLDGLADLGQPLLICNEEHRFVVAEQVRMLGKHGTVLLEPVGRNTAPAMTLAALWANRDGEDPVLVVMPADHVITDGETFRAVVTRAVSLAETGAAVTFGITPDCPETGYGYIEKGVPVGSGGFLVSQFVEKPNLEQAEDYLKAGNYLWNSGMFMFRASLFLAELERFRPDILEACREALATAQEDSHFLHVLAEQFARCDDESIDYAVMEHTANGVVVPLNAGWNDLGSWTAIYDISTRDADGNALQGDVLAFDSRNTLVQSHHRLVAVVGVEDLVVIETKDALLVTRSDKCQQVKQVVEQLRAEQRPEFASHPLVSRPWGHYDTVDHGERYQVKRITVSPGESLSLQLHYHRAEHWIVVSGTAKVICGDTETILSENQSTYIPLGVKHSLSNPGKVPLELIEVQSGAYLGEDDIVRFEDRYGRS